jgi:hypothetical protein
MGFGEDYYVIMQEFAKAKISCPHSCQGRHRVPTISFIQSFTFFPSSGNTKRAQATIAAKRPKSKAKAKQSHNHNQPQEAKPAKVSITAK